MTLTTPKRRALAGRLILASLMVVSGLLVGCDDGDDPLQPAKPGTLTLQMPAGPVPGPAGLHREVAEDVAERLGLALAVRSPVKGSPETVSENADAIFPAPVDPTLPDDFTHSQPYFQDPVTGVLYGFAVAPGTDPAEQPEILKQIDAVLSVMKGDATLPALYEKWLPGTEVPGAVKRN